MRSHWLKIWPEFYEDTVNEIKTSELRDNRDRDFRVGDFLGLEEWNPDAGEYTGNIVVREVTHILKGGQFGLEEGYCIMSLRSPKGMMMESMKRTMLII